MDIFKVLVTTLIVCLALALTLWSMREYGQETGPPKAAKRDSDPKPPEGSISRQKLPIKSVKANKGKGRDIKGIIKLAGEGK
jgi:hypothetical protein